MSEFNSINEQLARRTYETHGDYVTAPFTFEIDRVTWNWDAEANTETANVESDEITAVVGPGVAYIRGYRVENKGDRSFRIDEIGDDETELATDQPVSLPLGGYYRVTNANGHVLNLRSMQTVNLLAHSCCKVSECSVYICHVINPCYCFTYGCLVDVCFFIPIICPPSSFTVDTVLVSDSVECWFIQVIYSF